VAADKTIMHIIKYTVFTSAIIGKKYHHTLKVPNTSFVECVMHDDVALFRLLLFCDRTGFYWMTADSHFSVFFIFVIFVYSI